MFRSKYLLLTTLFACGPVVEVGTDVSPAVISTDDLWGRVGIPVCWTTYGNSTLQDRNRVQNAVINAFLETAVRFHGWGPCGELDGEEIRIEVFTGRSNSEVGKVEEEVTMQLDLVGERNRLENVAVHEFGHAIGLEHEQNRPRSDCEYEPEPHESGDVEVGPYDPNSIMDYCVNGSPTAFSDGDLLGIKGLFGSGGEFVLDPAAGKVYRRRGAQICHVKNPLQMLAFQGEIVTEETIAGNPPGCMWPDGTYHGSNGLNYFLIGDERASSPDTYCQIDGPEQLAAYGGQLFNVPDMDFLTGRQNRGTCPWSEGYYRLYNNNQVYRAYATTWCFVPDTEMFEVMSGDWSSIQDVPGWNFTNGRSNVGNCTVNKDFNEQNIAEYDLAFYSQQPGVTAISGRFDNDTFGDVVLVGGASIFGASWNYVVFGHGSGTGSFWTTRPRLDQQANPWNNYFGNWAHDYGAKAIGGDFNADGLTDIALVGGSGWGSVPIAFARGDGGFNVTNCAINAQANPDLNYFGVWSAQYGVRAVAADFDGDGDDDLALVGGDGWSTLPVAYSNRDGCFRVTNDGWTNPLIPAFNSSSRQPNVKIVAGNFDWPASWYDPLRASIALLGGPGWTTIFVARSLGTNGTFEVTNRTIGGGFDAITQQAVHATVGDFDHDLVEDILLTGNATWKTAPIIRFNGTGFTGTNNAAPHLRVWSSQLGAKVLAGDVDGDSWGDDLIFIGGQNWQSVPVGIKR